MDDTISQAPAAAEGRQEGSQAAEPDSQAGSSGEAVAELADTAKQHARQAAEQRKQDGAEKISGLGRAMHSAADELEAEMPGASRYVHEAASRIERAASALRERSIENLFSAFDGFARRQPGTAFGTAMLAGFAISRLVKSSPAQPRDPHGGRDRHGR